MFLRTDEDIRDDIVEHVFEHGIGIAVNPASVTVDVHDGEVALTGQLDLKSQHALVENMTRHIDGVVDVTATMTYRHDDATSPMPWRSTSPSHHTSVSGVFAQRKPA